MEENINCFSVVPENLLKTNNEESETRQENENYDFSTEKDCNPGKLKELEEKLSNLGVELSNKTDVINNLEKQKSLFEKEIIHVSNFNAKVSSINPISVQS